MSDALRQQMKEIFSRTIPNVDMATFDFTKERSHFESWDSLAHMQLISEFESAFHISFAMEEIAGINRLEDLVLLILKKVKHE